MKPPIRIAIFYSLLPWTILFLVRLLSAFQGIPLKDQLIIVGIMWLIISPIHTFIGLALAYREGQGNPK